MDGFPGSEWMDGCPAQCGTMIFALFRGLGIGWNGNGDNFKRICAFVCDRGRF